MGGWWPTAGLGALSVARDLLKEVTIISITTIAWPQVNRREGTQLYPSKETGLKIYWAWPCPLKQPSFPLSQSLPSGSFHKPLILLHERVERLKTTVTEN